MSKPRYAEVAGQPKTHVLAVNNKRVVSWNSKMKSGRCCYLLDDGKRCKNPAVGLNTKVGWHFTLSNVRHTLPNVRGSILNTRTSVRML